MTASKSLRSARRDARVAAWRRLPVLRQALQGRAAGGLGAGIAVRAKPARLCDLSALCPGHSAGAIEPRAARPVRLDISEGALVNILDASREPFATQTSLIKARLLAGTALASDETGMRSARAIGGSGCSITPTVPSSSPPNTAPRRSCMRSRRLAPDYWISDRYGGQMGWATREHQVCLAHLIRDVQYAIDSATRCSRPPEGLAQARLRHRASTRRSYRRHAQDLRG